MCSLRVGFCRVGMVEMMIAIGASPQYFTIVMTNKKRTCFNGRGPQARAAKLWREFWLGT
jgi:hypothetical protein